MPRQSKTKHVDVQTTPDGTYQCPEFHAFKNVCAFIVRSKTLYPDFRAFKFPHDQTFVRSKPKFVRSNFENFGIPLQTIVRSKTPMSRLSCGQKFLCVLRAFKSAYVLTFVRLCPDSFIYISCTQHFYNVFVSNIDNLG